MWVKMLRGIEGTEGAPAARSAATVQPLQLFLGYEGQIPTGTPLLHHI
jgi:hypothetical protein